MNPEQFSQFLAVFSKLVDRPYTLTGAADWPILAAMATVLVTVIAWMWIDLKATIRDGRSEWKTELATFKTEHDKEHDRLWQAHRDCQIDCCPRGKE